MSKLTRRRFIGTLMPAIALELTSPINFCRAETIPPKIKIRAVQSLSSYPLMRGRSFLLFMKLMAA